MSFFSLMMRKCSSLVSISRSLRKRCMTASTRDRMVPTVSGSSWRVILWSMRRPSGSLAKGAGQLHGRRRFNPFPRPDCLNSPNTPPARGERASLTTPQKVYTFVIAPPIIDEQQIKSQPFIETRCSCGGRSADYLEAHTCRSRKGRCAAGRSSGGRLLTTTAMATGRCAAARTSQTRR